MSLKKYFFFIVIVAILLSGLYGIDWLYKRYIGKREPPPYTALLNTNPAFAEGETLLFKDNQYQTALESYKQALLEAQGRNQEAQVKYKIAYATHLSGDRPGSIPLFKEIIANTTYPPDIRAYSVQYLSAMIEATGRREVVQEVYKGEPYASMFVPGNLALSVRHLNEYAISLYPLAGPEINIALWYADDIRTMQSTSTLQAQEELKLIQDRLRAADIDIARKQNAPSILHLSVAHGFEGKAFVLGKLASAGMVPVQEADAAFEKAFAMWKTYGIKDVGLRYHYAVYLSYFGKQRASELKEALKPFVDDPTYSEGTPFFMTERENRLGLKADLVRMATLDPDFKQYLMKRGWTAADFS